MEHGVMVATVVSVAWILVQNLIMHLRPAENRFGAMLLGYLLSLPFVFLAYRWLPGFTEAVSVESPTMGLFHAYFFHLLLFLFYAECFYHVERSVTFRLLVELLQSGPGGLPLQAIQSRYTVDEMVEQRLEVLRTNGFLKREGDIWRLQPKGLFLASVTEALSWVFQSKAQYERG
jgi:hypothetical protein